MQHTLELQDRVLVNKLVYDFRDPHRGEVIVFKSPLDWRSDPSEEDFIKRVIGVGGDHIVCCDAKGRITVNGKALDETYLYKNESGVSDVPSRDAFDITVPGGRLWVMGDHRSAVGRLPRAMGADRRHQPVHDRRRAMWWAGRSCCSGRWAGPPG